MSGAEATGSTSSRGAAAPTVALVAILLILAALFAAPGAGAAIYTLSGDPNAEKPDIAVDDAGIAHVAWNVDPVGIGDGTLVYCRVPRGAKGCASTQTFALPGPISRQWVSILGDGRLVLATERCCFPGNRIYALTSSDGGLSFSAPQPIAEAFYGWGEEVEPGPGEFSLSAAGGAGGCNDGVTYSAIPLSGVTTTWADLSGSCFSGDLYVSIGFPDPLTPLVAYRDWDTDSVLFRRWSGSGPYNDLASWGPVTAMPGAGDEPKLASGLRGLYLMYQGSKFPSPYHVRRYDGANFPKGSDRVVSDPKGGRPIFRDFLEDGGGNLHAVFRQDDARDVDGLRRSVSTDGGKSWQRTTVAKGKATEDLFNLRVGAAPDGGGAIVGDHNSDGPVWLAPFPPLGPGGKGACKPSVKVGGATAQALEGCFKRKGGKWVAGGAVKVNGIDLEPAGGGGKASASASFHVTAIPGQRRLTSSGPAAVRAGNVLLDKGPVDWRLPQGDGKVVRLGAGDGSVFPDLGKFAKKLFEFPVDGDAELLIAGKGARVPTHLRMPGLIGAVSGDTTLRTTASGLILGGMKIDVKSAAIGSGFAALRLAGIDVGYDGQNRFTGTAAIKLPPAYADPVKVLFAFEDGELSRLEIDPAIQFSLPGPLPIVGASPTPVVGLDSIGFAYLRKPDSRIFQGNLLLLAGPRLFGLRVVDLDGAVTLTFPVSKPSTLSATGQLHVVRLPLANAHVTYTVGAPGSLDFGGSYELLGVSGQVNGKVDLASGDFSASGSAGFGPASGSAVMTDDGFGACVSVLGEEVGFGWDWGDALPSGGCPGSGGLGRVAARAAAARGASDREAAAAQPIEATVRGKGRRRSLRFSLTRRAGQRVVFAEEAARVYRELGTTGKAQGKLRFRPAPGPGGRRGIVAIVEQDGIPWQKLTVAHYKAPPQRHPARPRRVLAGRRGGRLAVSWTPVKGARGYEVHVNLPRDGRRLLFFPQARQHRLRVRGIERTDTARVTVAAIGADLRPGPAARAKLRPAKPRRRRGR